MNNIVPIRFKITGNGFLSKKNTETPKYVKNTATKSIADNIVLAEMKLNTFDLKADSKKEDICRNDFGL